MKRLIFGVSGASGWLLAAEVLKHFAACQNIELHLVVSDAAKVVQKEEETPQNNINKFAVRTYDVKDMAAPIASGSWFCDGMIICPCSVNTLGAIACGLCSNLLQRAAIVTLKEQRPLILCVRETPFNKIILKNMLTLADSGASIMPFIPAFYAGFSMEASIRQFSGHLLDILHIPNSLRKHWKEDASFLQV